MNDSSTWTRLADTPVPYDSSLAMLKGQVLAIGGAGSIFGESPMGLIHCYDAATNLWRAKGEIPTPRCRVLTAVLNSIELVVWWEKRTMLHY